MTRKRNLVLVAVALVAVALVAANGSFVRGLFGQRAMLSVGGQQSGQQQTMPSPQASSAPQTLPSSGPAAAAAKTTTSLTITPDVRDRGYVLDARIVSKADGKAVANAVVRFYDVVQLLGTREMLIGSATTDGLGTVSIYYKPAQGGQHRIIARPASAALAATDGVATIDATVIAGASYARERLPLDRFSVNLPLAGETVLLVVWGLFAFVLIGSLIRIPRSADHDAPFTRKAREI
jgi:hypothetical protein